MAGHGRSASATAPTEVPATYIVQEGDTANAIARRAGLSLDALEAANPGADLDVLHPGDMLLLPPSPVAVAPDAIGGTLEVLDPSTGAVRATFDLGAFRAQYQQAMVDGSRRPNRRTVLLHSVDLATWSLHEVSAEVGVTSPFVSMLVSSDAGIVATVMTDEVDPDAPDTGTNGPVRSGARRPSSACAASGRFGSCVALAWWPRTTNRYSGAVIGVGFEVGASRVITTSALPCVVAAYVTVMPPFGSSTISASTGVSDPSVAPS